jgi:hypothetical protein
LTAVTAPPVEEGAGHLSGAATQAVEWSPAAVVQPARTMSTASRLKTSLLLFASYMAVGLALTANAWGDPTRRWVGQPGDPMKFMQFLAWYPFALGHGLNPLLDTYVNLPRGSNMMWDTTVPLVAVALWPLTALFGAVLAYNVAVAGALILDAWCSYLWLRAHVRHGGAAWLGGLVVLFSPYVSARLHGHLNLLYFFPVVLMVREIEKLLSTGGLARWRGAGVRIGLLAVVELLCCEEVLVLAAVALATVGLVLGLRNLPWVKLNGLALGKAAVLAAVTFFIGVCLPLGYQLFGPGRVNGPVQPLGYYVADLENFVVPGAFSALTPHFLEVLASHWTGDAIENDAYVGAPLIFLSLFVVLRFRRDPWVATVGVGTLGAALWSLGPYLHVGGQAYGGFPLPGRLLEALPLLDNVLPVRFTLFVDLGLAGLLAVFLDRVVLERRARWRKAGAAALVVACVPLAPQFPVGATGPATPRYFLPGGDVESLHSGTVALVVPYGDSEQTMAPMLWQAMAGFRFRMVSGAMINAGWHGYAAFGRAASGPLASRFDCMMAALQAGSQPPCTPHPVALAKRELGALGVRVIIMGPTSYGSDVVQRGPMEQFLSRVAGAPPSYEEGVLLWPYNPRASGALRSAP